MPGTFLDLVERDQLERVVLVIEHVVTRSFETDRARTTDAEVRRRFGSASACSASFAATWDGAFTACSTTCPTTSAASSTARPGARPADPLDARGRNVSNEENHMATTTMLDNISTAIEQVVKRLRGDGPTKKRMPLGEFVTFALAEIQKAAKDERRSPSAGSPPSSATSTM